MVGDNINGDILLNPGGQKLPKPTNQNGIMLRYCYYGYIIAPDRDEAENIFQKDKTERNGIPFVQKQVLIF